MKQRFTEINERIRRACDDAGRDPHNVTLIAVTKTRNVDQIREAMDLGITHFGENRVQEALEKWPAVKGDNTLHLIGPLQSNKVKQASQIFDILHTMDRVSLWEEMHKERWTPPFFVQVNTGEEPQKSGVLPSELETLLHAIDSTHLCGLMCIPPVDDSASPHFAFLNRLAKQHGLPQLSMGMSNDFEAAIRCGATHIRIGSLLFEG